MGKKKKLYAVSNAHLDTQWNWTIQDTIRDCVRNTLERNFDLLEKYPHYRMNFEGAFRYKLAKEYYPDLYEKLKKYVAEDRWNVAGSSWDACDVNVPSSEALMRQVLYGNGYFEKEFGKKSSDIFLTDCFGFRYSLPSTAAHMGLKGFSTQKLVWGAGSPIYEADGSVSKPVPDRTKPRMDLGRWQGPDGESIAVSLLEGDYTYNFDRGDDTRPVGQREEYLRAIEHNEKYTGVAVRSMYYGTGDYGGSPKEISARMVNEAIENSENALYEVVSASTDQIFEELTPEEFASLPVYNGELLIPHGSGALTSHTINKRWNRKCELLADSAERAASLALWLGCADYPTERLLTAWQTFLWHQFHDDLPGTSIAEAYVFTYNDYAIALNMFAAELNASMEAITARMDTEVSGKPLAVYNPLSLTRRDLVCAELEVASPYARVFDAAGMELPAQLTRENGRTVVKFVAELPPVSVSIFDVRESDTPCALTSSLSVSGNVLENARYRVEINADGDISSVIDKANGGMELLDAPVRLEIGPDTSTNWPSWELVCDDARKPFDVVGGDAVVEVADNGPACVSLKITRHFEGSTFVQTVSLCEGGERVDVANEVQWFQKKSNLRAAFPLKVSNPTATFDLGQGAIESGNTNDFPYYQHCVHQWADLTASDGSYGVSILNDCKYGMDKPADNILRLTLIHTPLGAYSDRSKQDWQDMGLNLFTYSIMGHAGFRTRTNAAAAALNQPAMAFAVSSHPGDARVLSLVGCDNDALIIRAVKKEEKGGRLIVRVQETSGKAQENCAITFAAPLTSAVETNGYEDALGNADFDGSTLRFSLTPYAVRTFAVTLVGARQKEAAWTCTLPLPYNKQITTFNDNRSAAELAEGISIPAELFEQSLEAGGIPFRMGNAGEVNAVACAGQEIVLPAGAKKLHLLATSAAGDRTVSLMLDGQPVSLSVQDYKENVGSWDMLAAGTSCRLKRDDIAVCYTHTHDAQGDRLYLFAYLFKYTLDVTGVHTVRLPDDASILVAAATASGSDALCAPAQPLYDRVEQSGKAVHHLEAVNALGSGDYEEGRVVLVSADYFRDGKLFDAWEGDGILNADGACAVVRMGDTDLHIAARYIDPGKDLLLGKPCKASGAFNDHETGDHALDGSDHSKWCARSDDGIHWLEVDLGGTHTIGQWMVAHAGLHESPSWTTRDFRLEYRLSESEPWQVADAVTGNDQSVTLRSFAPVDARFVRLFVTKPTEGNDPTVRVFSFSVYEA